MGLPVPASRYPSGAPNGSVPPGASRTCTSEAWEGELSAAQNTAGITRIAYFMALSLSAAYTGATANLSTSESNRNPGWSVVIFDHCGEKPADFPPPTSAPPGANPRPTKTG